MVTIFMLHNKRPKSHGNDIFMLHFKSLKRHGNDVYAS